MEKHINKEAVFDTREAFGIRRLVTLDKLYLYASFTIDGMPDEVKKELEEMHEKCWKSMLEIIKVRTGLEPERTMVEQADI